jgi:hypothetical protein
VGKPFKGGNMRKRQKLILIFYAIGVFLLSFVYVPYARYYPNCVKAFIGHHLRAKISKIILGGEDLWGYGYIVIDAPLIIAEVLALTAIAGVAFLLLKRE